MTHSQKSSKTFQGRYNSLNDKQRMAVDMIDGPVLVVAGPGSGKTELLGLRTAKILQKTQVSAGNILLLTFTESGAQNMRERLVGLIGEAGYRVAIYTFHAFASDVMSRYGEYFFEGASFRPASDVERIGILENILEKLNRDNPLSSRHPELGYTYLYDILSTISALKKGNLTGEEWRNVINKNQEEYQEVNNALGEIFAEIKGKSKYDVLREVYARISGELKYLAEEKENDTAKFLLTTLKLEISQTYKTEKSKNLTEWKDSYFTKNEDGILILKDSKDGKIEKWLSLADVYEKYNSAMYEKGFYDFDDMIFKVSHELEKNEALRGELEEKYQYIMIDEFQDTSDSQFSLVKNLTSNPVNEGRPNVMAVGDDDQAIFKFQGAELDNITKFINSYTGVQLITLDKNYRSTQNILDQARNLITKIDDRLEVRFPKDINKNIRAENKKLLEKHGGKIIRESFDNPYHEMDFIAREIKNILDKKVDPKEITIISRSHANLKLMAQILNEHKLPYSYEKKENVFDKQPIKELIKIVEFVDTGTENMREDFLPEILSYKFWNIDRLTIWKIAEEVRAGEISVGEFGEKIKNRVSWISVMLNSKDEKVADIARFLIDLIADSKSMPLPYLLDKIIGTREWEIDSSVDDGDEVKSLSMGYISPFREYYFGKDNFEHNKPEYLDFLFALRTFMGALRDYRNGEILYAKDLKTFVEIYDNNNNLSLTLTSPFATSKNAIVLQTAHKSKGLEYEYVFIMNSDEDEWNGKKRANKIGMPVNLPLLPASDDISDRVRLYYVAMTRAKHTLYITNNSTKFSKLLSDESEEEMKENKEKNLENSEINKNILNSLYITERNPLIEDEKILLERLLENYKMPVTHLINFLNISKIGPEKFIEQNLLRFPQAMTASSVYGSAMHEAMQNYYLYFKKYEEKPDLEKIISYFKKALERGSLDKIDFDKYYESGVKNLEIYLKDLEERKEDRKIEVEVNFANEGVTLDNAQLTGKIDKMEILGNQVKVTDLKTGKSFKDWDDGSSPYDKIKLHFFKYQLAFYSILIKNSRSYNGYELESGYIEFLEADSKKKINILELDIDEELLERVKSLTKIVYQKVMNLDFPDTSSYFISEKTGLKKEELTLKDIEKFEEDLLNGNI